MKPEFKLLYGWSIILKSRGGSGHNILNDSFKRIRPNESPPKSDPTNLFAPPYSKKRKNLAWSNIFKVLYVADHTKSLGKNGEYSLKMIRSSPNFACNLPSLGATTEAMRRSTLTSICILQHFSCLSVKSPKLICRDHSVGTFSKTEIFDHLSKPQKCALQQNLLCFAMRKTKGSVCDWFGSPRGWTFFFFFFSPNPYQTSNFSK